MHNQKPLSNPIQSRKRPYRVLEKSSESDEEVLEGDSRIPLIYDTKGNRLNGGPRGHARKRKLIEIFDGFNLKETSDMPMQDGGGYHDQEYSRLFPDIHTSTEPAPMNIDIDSDGYSTGETYSNFSNNKRYQNFHKIPSQINTERQPKPDDSTAVMLHGWAETKKKVKIFLVEEGKRTYIRTLQLNEALAKRMQAMFLEKMSKMMNMKVVTSEKEDNLVVEIEMKDINEGTTIPGDTSSCIVEDISDGEAPCSMEY